MNRRASVFFLKQIPASKLRHFYSGLVFSALFLLAVSSLAQCPDATFRVGEGLRGVDGRIRACVLWDRDGAGGEPPVLVVAGQFTVAGTTFANNIALWNGTFWEPLGAGTPAGVNGGIYSLAVSASNELVAGGAFHLAGGVSAEHIARWNGTNWSSVGSGILPVAGSTVFAMTTMPNGDLIAAGHFTNAGGVVATNIARWNGTSWSGLANGVGNNLSASIFAVTVRTNGSLVAAGSFSAASGTSAANIASWNGAAWSAYSLGLSTTITALANLPGGDLVAAGAGANVNGGSGSHVLRWNGSAWSGMSAGFYTGNTPSVLTMTVLSNGTLVAGGSFSIGTSAGALNIATFNGSTWVGLGGGAPAQFVDALAELSNHDLVIGGNIIKAGNVAVQNMARWDGTKWNFFVSGFTGAGINTFLRTSNGDLYAGGSFTSAGTVEAVGVARKTSSGWATVGTGLSDVTAMVTLPNGNILAAGSFLSAPIGVSPQPLAVWDGNSWTKFGPDSSPFPVIRALGVMTNGDVIAGGTFSSIGGFSVSTLARWNGTTWSAVGPSISGSVYAVATLTNGDLIVGTDFFSNGIARWNGTVWMGYGTGMNSSVLALYPLPNGDLLAGGRFGTAGGVGASRIARWNGTTWSPLGSGVSPIGTPYVNAITVLTNDDIIIGGSFSGVGSSNTLSVGRWTGTNWTSLGGSGASTAVLTDIGGVNALAALPDGGFVMGGGFTAVNGYVSRYFSQWGCPVGPLLDGVMIGANGLKFSFQGTPGKTYGISYSTNLSTWQVIQVGLQGSVVYEDLDSAHKAFPHGYYRVIEQ